MYKKIINNISNGLDIRKNLIELKKIIKDDREKKQLAYYLKGDYKLLIDCLKSDDAKVRRNAALILGEMEDDDLAFPIFEAYKAEETMFIRADYLRAMQGYCCDDFIEYFMQRLKELSEIDISSDEEKHYQDEISALKNIVYSSERCQHEFVGLDKKLQLFLTAYSGCIDVLIDKLKSLNKRIAKAGNGVMVYGSSLGEVKDIRVYKELLIPVCDNIEYSSNNDIIDAIKSSDIMLILRNLWRSDNPFTYRLSVKGVIQDTRDIVLDLTKYIDKNFGNDLINSTSDYQIELRVIFKSNNLAAIYIKPYLLENNRFYYRIRGTSESMKPVLAASIVEYCSKYFKPDASIIDPFCGSGILLIERYLKEKCKHVVAIDIMDKAVDATLENTSEANIKVELVCKNFFNYERYKDGFDELITDLPKISSKRDEQYIQKLYNKFLIKSDEVLKNDSYMFIFCPLPNILKPLIDERVFEIVDEKLIRNKDESTLLIIRKI